MAETARRGGLGRIFILAGLLAMALFLTLGVWQVQRLQWKLDLIARVEARLAADPVTAPGPADWAGLAADQSEYARAEYTRVGVTGHYLSGPQPLVQAVTEHGRGFWVMTPLQTAQGWTVLVNRGFIPENLRDAPPAPETGEVTVQGLLRMDQPGGGFLRHNDPPAGRWFSRDVGAMATALNLPQVAPYFIDAAAGPAPLPIGGLTVVQFRNSHLSYALTWFALAAGLAFLLWRAFRPH